MKITFPTLVALALLFSVSSSYGTPPVRNLEPLEQFELSSLKFEYVGDSNTPCGPVAYIRDPKGYMHQVRVNNYMGKHMGRVIKLTERELQLQEWPPNSKGELVESLVVMRPAIASTPPKARVQSNNSFKADGLQPRP